MASHIQYIVGAAHHHVIAVVVAQGYVAGEVDTGDSVPVLGVAFGVAEHGPVEVGERLGNHQKSALVRFRDGLSFPVDDVQGSSGHCDAHPTRSDRQGGRGPEAGSAGLGLPPVVHDMAPLAVAADELVGPLQGLGIEWFAGAGQEPQRPKVIFLGVFFAVAHQHAQ